MTAPNNLQTWPAEVWLNVGDAGYLPPKDECAEVTWSDCKIDSHDVRYIRHDLVDEQINDLHISLACAELHAESGWSRYSSANADRNAVRAERVQLVARIADLEQQLAAAGIKSILCQQDIEVRIHGEIVDVEFISPTQFRIAEVAP